MRNLFISTVLCVLMGTSSAIAHEMNWSNLMLASVKLQPDFNYKEHVDSYMIIFRKDVWHKYRNDEFELNDKRDETIRMMKEKVSSFSLDENFVLHASMEFGDYDFDKGVFPIKPITPTTYFSGVRRQSFTFPSEYHIFFSNGDKLGDISMPKDEARTLVADRKTKFGTVNRDLFVEIKFRVSSLKENPHQLEAEIDEITIYADSTQKNVLQKF